MSLKVGILAGLGPAATVLYYRRLMEGLDQHHGAINRPDFIIYSLDSRRMKELYNQGLTDKIVDNLVLSLQCLEKAGCDFGIIACNTVHLFIEAVLPRIQLPLINLIDTVVDKILKCGSGSLGLLGTTITMDTSLYRAPLEEKGIKVLVPAESERKWVDHAISNDFQQSTILAASLNRLKDVMLRLKDDGARQILLGCTDFPMEAAALNIGIPVHESTEIHVQKTLDKIFTENV